MIVNAELRRNLWLEMSPLRMALGPMVVTLLVYVFGYLADQFYDIVAYYLFVLATVFWGTRRAAASVFDELTMGTWDNQRMSSLGSWTLTLGKLAGATIYPWYCSLILIGVMWVRPGIESLEREPLPLILSLVAWAITAQASALAASLLLVRRAMGRPKRSVTLAQLAGLSVGGIIYSTIISPQEALANNSIATKWYGIWLDENFALLSLVGFCIWSVLWAERQMRIELQYRTWPWLLPAFLAFMVVYISGFLLPDFKGELPTPLTFALVTAGTGLAFTYLTLFVEPKDKVALRRYARLMLAGDWGRALEETPPWLFGFLAVLAAVVYLGPSVDATQLNGLNLGSGFAAAPLTNTAVLNFLVCLMLFVFRDMTLIIALSFGRKPARADFFAVVLLILMYFVLPLTIINQVPDAKIEVFALFWPVPGESALFSVLPALVSLAPVLGLAWYQWRRNAQALR